MATIRNEAPPSLGREPRSLFGSKKKSLFPVVNPTYEPLSVIPKPKERSGQDEDLVRDSASDDDEKSRESHWDSATLNNPSTRGSRSYRTKYATSSPTLVNAPINSSRGSVGRNDVASEKKSGIKTSSRKVKIGDYHEPRRQFKPKITPVEEEFSPPPDRRRRGEAMHIHPLAPISVDPVRAADTTIHMSIPTIYDIEGVLENASRLRRIGHFKAAIEIYETALGQFLDNKYVQLQYAECLWDAGQISKISMLPNEAHGTQRINAVDLNWTLIRWLSGIEIPSDIEKTEASENARALLLSKWPLLYPTEIQLLGLMVDLDLNPFSWLSTVHWHELYLHLCDEELIWEFHDLLASISSKLGPDMTWSLFFDVTLGHTFTLTRCLEQLEWDWPKEAVDTPTNYALLDFLTDFGLHYLAREDTKDKALICLTKAGEYARQLLSDDPNSIKSRPCLRWIVAQGMMNEPQNHPWLHHAVSIDYTQGRFLGPRGVFPNQSWPIYIPIDKETPSYNMPVRSGSSSIVEKLRIALQLTEDLGDLRMQTACLKELMFNGAESTETTIDKLEALWKQYEYSDPKTQMHLYQYVLAHTQSDREQVRHRILLDGEMDDQEPLYYARCKIMAALSSNNAEAKFYQRQASKMSNKNTLHVGETEVPTRPKRVSIRPKFGGSEQEIDYHTAFMRQGIVATVAKHPPPVAELQNQSTHSSAPPLRPDAIHTSQVHRNSYDRSGLNHHRINPNQYGTDPYGLKPYEPTPYVSIPTRSMAYGRPAPNRDTPHELPNGSPQSKTPKKSESLHTNTGPKIEKIQNPREMSGKGHGPPSPLSPNKNTTTEHDDRITPSNQGIFGLVEDQLEDGQVSSDSDSALAFTDLEGDEPVKPDDEENPGQEEKSDHEEEKPTQGEKPNEEKKENLDGDEKLEENEKPSEV